MQDDTRTFPTLRSWRRMSEREQDALIDRIETRRRRRVFASRAAVAFIAAAAVVAVLLVLAR